MFSEKKEFVIVSIPEWRGAGRRGTESGPKTLKKFNLEEKLRADGVKVFGWYEVEPALAQSADLVSGNIKYETEITLTQKRSFLLLRHFIEEGMIPIVLGGDHTVSIASVSAQAAVVGSACKVGLIWIDAHGDVHTPETSPSGNAHGMPLAILLGDGSPRLTGLGGEFSRKVYPGNVVHVGANSVEKEEEHFFLEHNIRLFSGAEIETNDGFERMCQAITLLDWRVQTIVVSIDADAFHETIAPGVHLRNKNGITEKRAYALADHIRNCRHISGVDITEIVPCKDSRGKTIQFMSNFLLRILTP